MEAERRSPRPRPSPTGVAPAVAAPDLVAAPAGACRLHPAAVAHVRQPARRARPAAPAHDGGAAFADRQGLQGGQPPGHALAEGRRPADVDAARVGGARGHAQAPVPLAERWPGAARPRSTTQGQRLLPQPVELTGRDLGLLRARDVPRPPGADRQLAGRRGLPQHGGAPQEVGGDDGRGGGRRHRQGLRAQAGAREPRARQEERQAGRHGHVSPRLRVLARPGAGRGQGRGPGRRRRAGEGADPRAADDRQPGRARVAGARAAGRGRGELRGLLRTRVQEVTPPTARPRPCAAATDRLRLGRDR